MFYVVQSCEGEPRGQRPLASGSPTPARPQREPAVRRGVGRGARWDLAELVRKCAIDPVMFFLRMAERQPRLIGIRSGF